MFLSQEIKNTPVEGTINMEILNKMHFDNFTYSGSQEKKEGIAVTVEDAYEVTF